MPISINSSFYSTILFVVNFHLSKHTFPTQDTQMTIGHEQVSTRDIHILCEKLVLWIGLFAQYIAKISDSYSTKSKVEYL